MTKSKRRSKRSAPKRTATRKPYLPGPPRLRIAIATSPNSEGSSPSLEQEVRLVRSAVLYADEVELVSPGAEMLAGLAALASGNEGDLLDFFLTLDDSTVTALGADIPLPPNWRQILRTMSTLTSEDLDLVSQITGESIPDRARSASAELRNGLSESLSSLSEAVEEMLETAGAREITPAIDAGIVKLSPTIISPANEGDSAEMVRRYVEKLRQLLVDPRTHLLLDDAIASLVRSLIEEGHVDPHQLATANAGEAAVGSGLITRLPAFSSTPIDELLDLRHDMDDPLSRYRRSVAILAERLRVGPFDAALQADIDHLYITEVEPALRDLRDGFSEHGLIKEIARRLSSDVKAVATATVGPAVSLGATTLADLSGWITFAGTTLSVLGPSAQVITSAVLEQRKQERALQRRDLYYLFEIERSSARGLS